MQNNCEVKYYREKVHIRADGRKEREILAKIQNVRNTTQFLKHRLAQEKQELERERRQTNSVYSLPAPSVVIPMRANYVSYPDFQPPYYYQAVPDCQRYIVVRPPTLNYPYPMRCLPDGPYPPVQLSNVYKSHLDDVNRQCEEEWFRMQSNLNNIKKMKKYWNEHNGPNKPAESNYGGKTVRRRIRRRVYYGDDYDN